MGANRESTLDAIVQMDETSKGRGKPITAPNTSEYGPGMIKAALYDATALGLSMEKTWASSEKLHRRFSTKRQLG